jgi:hypothetical protein
MPISGALRDISVGLVSAIATAAGLVALTPWSWTITIPASVVLGSGALLTDLLFLRRSHPATGRRVVIAVLSAIALFAALWLSFFAGRNTQAGPDMYPFVVTAGGGPVAMLKIAPLEGAQSDRALPYGLHVDVDCYVVKSDGRWYRLSRFEGWLRGDEVAQAPYTGRASPPRCPGT